MRIALLISGNGTTAEQIILATHSERLRNVEPALVIATRADAPGIERAVRAGIPSKDVIVIAPSGFLDEQSFGNTIIAACEERGVDFIGQYGWMAKTPANVIERFKDMMVNQHPGPLDPGKPDFGGIGMYGRRVHAARLWFVRKTNRDFWTETTAQRVGIQFDEGAVVKRKKLDILPSDDPITLQERLLPLEYEVQIEALEDFARGTAKEIVRVEPLIRSGEESILEECKKEAIKLYP